MRNIKFKPFPDTEGHVVGLLHEPMLEREDHRELFPTVVICPGGGYGFVSDREADPVAAAYFAAGYQVFILYYSVCENAANFTPLRELSQTIFTLRENCDAWHIDENAIAVCGFSAGGHLAASSGILWNHPKFLQTTHAFEGRHKPNVMILSYPVITADEFAHEGSISAVSGAKPGTAEYEFFSLPQHVSADTVPAFIWHTVTDETVPIENSISLVQSLQKNHISYEVHFFPTGAHGISVCTKEVGEPDPYNARWMDMSIAWLNKQFDYIL
jgi:Esterase/lipase